MKLDDGQLSLFLEMLDYAAFALVMLLKMNHILCWNVPYISPLAISFHRSKGPQVFFQLGHQVDTSL